MTWLAAVLSIPLGMAANFAFQWALIFYRRVSERVEIKGIWAERMRSGSDRQCSIGRIRYSIRRSMWLFDGTNYHNDGRAFCHWRTISSYLDTHNKVFYYIFLNTPEEEAHIGYTGFGIVHLVEINGEWIPIRGTFAAGGVGEIFRSHSMVKIDQEPETQADTVALFRDKLGMSDF